MRQTPRGLKFAWRVKDAELISTTEVVPDTKLRGRKFFCKLSSAASVENYFNYFTQIEDHFQRRRGTLTLMSPLDWALMEIWKDAGIPLEAVLRGMDAAFDKWVRR